MDKLIKYQEAQIVIPKCEIKKTGLLFKDSLTFDEWGNVGKLLNQIEGATQWWIGDWLNYGNFKWGEKYKEAIEKTEFNYGYTRNLKSVSNAIELSRRRDKLTWAHHQEIASFDLAEQDYWLDKAEKEGWIVKELRRQIRESKIEKPQAFPSSQGQIYKKDAFDFLAECNREFDLLITDPPYMTDLDDVGIFAIKWLPLALSKIKPTGRAYIFTGAYPFEIHSYLTVLLQQTAFTLDNILVWTYRNTMGPSPKMGYKLNWQAIFYLYGPEADPLDCPRLIEQFTVQDFNQPFSGKDTRYSQWQKPIELAEILIRHSTNKGDFIIDPFAGTGTFVIQSILMGRKAIGCEIDDEMIKACKKRGLTINE